MSLEGTELASKERAFQFILTFLEERHSLFSSGVGVILEVGYLTLALVGMQSVYITWTCFPDGSRIQLFVRITCP